MHMCSIIYKSVISARAATWDEEWSLGTKQGVMEKAAGGSALMKPRLTFSV